MSIPHSHKINTLKQPNQRAWLWFAVEAILVLGVILAHGARAVPTTNEAHYLAKAKHFWNPTWASGDFFLQSKDAHWLFFAGFGWLTIFFSLSVTTWIVRIVIWSALAAAWTRLSRTVVDRRFFAVLSMAVFVATQKRLTLSIEWVVDAIEAKVLAYAFLFWGLADLLESRWWRAWTFFGLATAWHPVVGGWATLVALAYVAFFVGRSGLTKRSLLGMVLGFAIALIGVIPPLLINRGADPSVVEQAHQIQVYKRLPHHLYPPGFIDGYLENHLLMLAAWIGFGGMSLGMRQARHLQIYVLLSLAISVGGLVMWLALPDGSAAQASVLRFYWFRLFDVLVAVGMSIGMMAFVSTLELRNRACWILMLMMALSVNFWERGQDVWSGVPGQFKLGGKTIEESRARFQSWKDVTQWIREETPPDATFVTPVRCQTFTWFAHRGKVVSWKDAPQDAGGLVEWHRRMDVVHRATRLDDLNDTFHEREADELRKIGKDLGAQYLIYFTEQPLELPVKYENAHFVVYSLR